MKDVGLSCRAAIAGAAIALLAGCGVLPLSSSKGQDVMQPPTGAPGAMPQSRALATRDDNSNYRVVYRFLRKPDGNVPHASLIDVHGTLYSTTGYGGTAKRGVVFSITKAGTEKVLYSFRRSPDGAIPLAGLIDVNGTLYGTTDAGGIYFYSTASYTAQGTVFSITTSGSEKVLHSFGYGTDGIFPVAGLIDVDGTLYGTTVFGGTHGNGTVFSITTSGSEKVVYSFAGGTDGSSPAAGLIKVGGTLYGTTSNGGGSGCYGGAGCGTVYSISASGAETVLHHFTGGGGGAYPDAGLLDIGGVLYGTTSLGGRRRACYHVISDGCGTVFALSL